MAAVDLSAVLVKPKAHFKPIINNAAASRMQDSHHPVAFDPKKHLAYEPPKEIISMEDIGFSKDSGVSPVAVSQPFRLFSTECIQKFRDEGLSQEVLANCTSQSNIAACHVRGYVAKYAPFTYDTWQNPELLSIISQIAGVDLIPNMNLEISQLNISVKSEKESKAELDAVESERKHHAEDEGIAGCPWEDDKPVVGWHNDSYPFVCVTMLSDCSTMVGGETALITGNGDVMKVRGPQMGCAMVMQGRYITHQALRALGAAERITMVTSLRPRNPLLPDDSNLKTVRGISVLSDLYYEFGSYRLEMLEERIRDQLKRLRNARAAGWKTDTRELKKFLAEQEEFLRRTNEEIIQDEDVVAGHQPEVHFPDEKARSAAKKARLECGAVLSCDQRGIPSDTCYSEQRLDLIC